MVSCFGQVTPPTFAKEPLAVKISLHSTLLQNWQLPYCSFYQLGVLVVRVLAIKALPLGVYIRAN